MCITYNKETVKTLCCVFIPTYIGVTSDIIRIGLESKFVNQAPKPF